LCEVVDVEMGSLGDGAPLAVEQDERGEAIGIGGRKNPRSRVDVVSVDFEARMSQSIRLWYSLFDNLVGQLLEKERR
jgi:hypothetical protein